MLSIANTDHRVLMGGAGLFLITVLCAIATDLWFLIGIPFAVLFAVGVILNPKLIYLSLFGLIPFSTEVNLPGGIGLDFPGEPLMIAVTGLVILLAIEHLRKWDGKLFYNSLTLIILAIFGWSIVTTLFSTQPVISVKYLAAKLWYIIPFYFGTLIFYQRNIKLLRPLIKLVVGMTLVATLYVVVRHGMMSFAFDSVNRAGRPFFRNHVTYGALLVLILPYLLYLWKTSKHPLKLAIYGAFLLLFGIAIYTTYTRAAYVCVLGIVAGYFMIRFKLTTIAIIAALLVSSIGVSYLVHKNQFLEYAPDYQKTVTHHNINNLMEATVKGEDISTMERVYRWVAGVRMIATKPLVGFGPSAFYESYEPYTLNRFETYVSDNPEKSGIHNYYLMTCVEQGIPGFLLFLLLTALPLIIAERTYHQLQSIELKSLVLAAALSLITIDLLLLINDLLEADKIGSYYYWSLAIITLCTAVARSQSRKSLGVKKEEG